MKDVSEESIYRVARDTGFAEVCRLLRQIFEFTVDGPQWRDGVLLERLFELDEVLMARLQAAEGLTPPLILEVELVIRRFDQHYQNMCGFDSIQTARKYLHLFEVKGRELDIRGKCPLELAGYDISQIPIARILRGQFLGCRLTPRELVPNA